MGRESPAVILYDNQGHAIDVVLEGGVYKLRTQVTGSAPNGSAVSGNPVLIGGSDGTNVRSIRTSTDGTIRIDPTGTTTQPVSVSSLPLPSGAATETTLALILKESVFTARINTLGQKSMANSTPVVLASDQSTITVSAASLPLPTGAATEATLANLLTISAFTDRINTLGQKVMTASTPVVIASDQSTLPISAASLPLPTGSATESTLSTRLADATFTARINTLGQKTKANSTPVTIASDQDALVVSGTVTADIGSTNGLALDTTVNSLLKESTFTTRINTLGQKTASASMPVVIASNQSAIPVTILEGSAGGVQKSLYDVGVTDIYIGTAAQGTDPSASAWLIKKITLDGSGNPISTLYSSDTAIWNNRVTEIYS